MKILANTCYYNKQSNIDRSTFKGMPLRLPAIEIRNYHDALEVWNKLKSAKYLDAHCNSYYDKLIRKENYSFLDKLTSNADKSAFVEKFCDFTCFPNLRLVSNKIHNTFQSCINNISGYLNNRNLSSEYDILDWGYDPTCSLGLKKSFPASDLDKGYVILRGNPHNSKEQDKKIINDFSGSMWEDIDQRIVSLNHPNTYPSVYTKKQIEDILNNLDAKARDVEGDLRFKAGVKTFMAITAATLLGPFALIGGGAIAGALLAKHFQKMATTTDPYVAAKFNREIAKKINNSEEREKAKNFAFFIEIVAANLRRKPYGKNDSIFTRITESPFVENSNVTQVEAWQHKIDGGYLKSKLRNRDSLESDFYKMSSDTKYDLVKDIIKYGTDDQSDKFSQYFKNDDDIANRYEPLLNSLK